MAYWNFSLVSNLVGLAVCLAVAGWLRRRLPFWRRIGIPDAFVAGLLGMAVGPGGLGLPPFDTATLEGIVYHAFGLMFIAVSLQRPPQAPAGAGKRPAAVRMVALCVPTTAILQVLVGLLVVSILAAASVHGAHPGMALLVMLGFSAGPGQALALGSAWEPLGLADGAQLGLGFAASGFVVCGLLGIPLVAFARRRGWLTPVEASEPATASAPAAASAKADGQMERLTAQVVALGCLYAATYGLLWAMTQPLPADHPMRASLWGFHFIFGAILALALRRLSQRARFEEVFDDDLLGRISVVAVDFTTAAAVAALVPSVLAASWVGLVTVSLAVAGTSLSVALWLSRRAFRESPFEHALILFGTATGTLATGLTLLRSVDPELRSPAARNMVLGAAAGMPLMVPLILGVLPFAVSLWPKGLASSILIPGGVLVIYLGVLGFAWWKWTPARMLKPLTSLWPDDEPCD